MASLIQEPERQIEMLSGNWEKLGDAARKLGVSEITLRRRVKAGRLQHDFRGGRYFVFIPDGVNARHFLDSHEMDSNAVDQASGRAPESILGPYPGHRPFQRANGVKPGEEKTASVVSQGSPVGPSSEQILAIFKIELQQKQLEIDRLTRELKDQVTLNEALEAALEEATSRGI